MSKTAGLGDRVRQAREALGISCNELDRRAGLGVSVTSKIETGTRTSITAETAARLAMALGITSDALLYGEDA